MARSVFLLYHFYRRRLSDSFRGFFFIPASLALITSLFILLYISSTSKLFTHPDQNIVRLKPPLGSSLISSPAANFSIIIHEIPGSSKPVEPSQRSQKPQLGSNGNFMKNEVFHDKDIFMEDYKEMNRSFKIYVYPHRQDDSFANALLPVDFEPGGNYASESYFKKVLMKSHFITKDPSKADLFFLPFSIARLRHDSRVGVGGIQDFIRDYIFNISRNYPYWNRTGGADHFYVACHSIGRSAMEKADMEKARLFAGAINSPVREKLLEVWRNDSEIFAHFGRLTTPYADELLGSKFCLHVKGFEVNTARIADSLYYGCVPVIIANHYDLPFADILNWKSFSIVVATLDIPMLKEILQRVSSNEYLKLQSNVLKVRKHFKWHTFPANYDAFYMVMYELWLRRSSDRFMLNALVDPDGRLC